MKAILEGSLNSKSKLSFEKSFKVNLDWGEWRVKEKMGVQN